MPVVRSGAALEEGSVLEVGSGAAGEQWQGKQCRAEAVGSHAWGLCSHSARGLRSPSCMPRRAPSLSVAQVLFLVSWLEQASRLL